MQYIVNGIGYQGTSSHICGRNRVESRVDSTVEESIEKRQQWEIRRETRRQEYPQTRHGRRMSRKGEFQYMLGDYRKGIRMRRRKGRSTKSKSWHGEPKIRERFRGNLSTYCSKLQLKASHMYPKIANGQPLLPITYIQITDS